MNRVLFALLAGTLGACTVAAQGSASAQAGASTQSETSVHATKSGTQASTNNSASAATSAQAGRNSADTSSAGALSGGTKIDSTLTKPLDAKKCKPGDPVEARTTEDVKQDGKVVLKKGTTLMGHVTEAQARASGQSESRLGVAFDHAVLKNGSRMPLNATIQALAVSQSSAMAGAGSDEMMASSGTMTSASGATRGGGVIGGATSTVGSTTGTVMNTAGSLPAAAGANVGAMTHSNGAVGGLTSSGRLSSNSSGVFGLQGLSLASAASGEAQSSTIVSATKNVHLESGTQMLLSVGAEAH